MNFLYRYMFRSFSIVVVAAVLTILWTACNPADEQRERKLRNESKRVLDAQHAGASDQMRTFRLELRKEKKP